jgi:hypothetical protein
MTGCAADSGVALAHKVGVSRMAKIYCGCERDTEAV